MEGKVYEIVIVLLFQLKKKKIQAQRHYITCLRIPSWREAAIPGQARVSLKTAWEASAVTF